MARSLIEERYTWPVRTVLLGGGSPRATSYQILLSLAGTIQRFSKGIFFLSKSLSARPLVVLTVRVDPLQLRQGSATGLFDIGYLHCGGAR